MSIRGSSGKLPALLAGLMLVAGCGGVSHGDCPEFELTSSMVCERRHALKQKVRAGEYDETNPVSISTHARYQVATPTASSSVVIPVRVSGTRTTFLAVGPVRKARLLDEEGVELAEATPTESCDDTERELMFRLKGAGQWSAWLELELHEGTDAVEIHADDVLSVGLEC